MVVAAQVVSQLQDPTVMDWVSDSSMSKTAHGKLSRVTKSKNGLGLELSTGRVVNWRMPEKIANEVMADLRAAEINPTDEIGVEEVYSEDIREFTDEELWLQKNNW